MVQEGQIGKLKPHVVNIAMNLQGCDLLQQEKTQINIVPIPAANYKIRYASEGNIKLYISKKQQFLVFQT